MLLLGQKTKHILNWLNMDHISEQGKELYISFNYRTEISGPWQRSEGREDFSRESTQLDCEPTKSNIYILRWAELDILLGNAGAYFT